MDAEDIAHFKKAGEIAKQVFPYAIELAKPGVKLLEIAEKIEARIVELGGKPAFPVNLSMNDIAAHYTPSHEDAGIAGGLLKVDFGVHIEGCLADGAVSVDLENSEENKKLIEASKRALEQALALVKKDVALTDIGKIIQDTIVAAKFSPIGNLSGHEILPYMIHAGLTIPNVANGNTFRLDEGVYAIEPFATTGAGYVYEGKPSGIYQMKQKKPVRDPVAREMILFIEEEYEILPFCSRWLVKKFGARALFALQGMEQQGIVYQYPQLIEKNHGKVSQAERTILITKDGVEVLN